MTPDETLVEAMLLMHGTQNTDYNVYEIPLSMLFSPIIFEIVQQRIGIINKNKLFRQCIANKASNNLF